MITRLQIDGFKNLLDVDIHFGKFNVITGANGIGKSNLFDVIQFISHLIQTSLQTEKPLIAAMKHVRGAERNPNKAFFRKKNLEYAPLKILIDMSFRTDKMHYELSLETQENQIPEIKKHSFRQAQGRSIVLKIANPRAVNRDLYNESSSWQILDLSPKKIRIPDTLADESRIGNEGEHLPTIIERMAQSLQSNHQPDEPIYNKLSNRLFEITNEIKDIRVWRSEEAESISIQVKDPDGTWHNASALSDGTLRFLAFAVLWLDPEAKGTFCIEEPENGIHPSKIPAMMRLLRDISEKPGCQVIVNTHSPLLVAQAPAEDIIVASPVSSLDSQGNSFIKPKFYGLKGTWREKAGMPIVPISVLSPFLELAPDFDDGELDQYERVVDRADTKRLLKHLWTVESAD